MKKQAVIGWLAASVALWAQGQAQEPVPLVGAPSAEAVVTEPAVPATPLASEPTPAGPLPLSLADNDSDDSHVLFTEGLASWYGPRFHGRRTANGERYDMHSLTAAHKFLPFGTRVRVRSVHTGREVVVRVNDRGPYKHQRVMDLSRAAMEALGVLERGVTRVELWVESHQAPSLQSLAQRWTPQPSVRPTTSPAAKLRGSAATRRR